MARTQDEIIKDLRNVECGLSPENLHCDGEISRMEKSHARKQTENESVLKDSNEN